MELTDALTITGLGMAVVFSGLLLTAGLIVVFGRLQRFESAPPAEPEPAPVRAVDDARGEPVAPEIVTVITTVLEVERRLHRVRTVARDSNDE